MRQSERAWHGSEVPYFGRYAAPRPEVPARAETFFPFADHGARTAQRIMAVLIAVGSVLGGAALAGLMLVVSFVLSFGSPADGTDVLVAALLGGALAVGGVVSGILAYRQALRQSGMAVHDDGLAIRYPSFRRPMMVPRAAVRAVAFDDAGRLARERFPVAGDLPDDVFVDALDHPSAGPLEDLETARRGRTDPSPGVIWERPDLGARGSGYAHDNPDHAGWASAGAMPPMAVPQRSAFLFGRHGSSLPFLRSGALDMPNVAVLFHDRIRTPRPSLWFDLSPIMSRLALFRGGRPTRGVLLHVTDPGAVAAAMAPWGIVREITAEDVTQEGLLLAKPLVGWRAAAYAAIVVGPVLLNLLLRALR